MRRVVVIATIGQFTREGLSRPFWAQIDGLFQQTTLPEHRIRKYIGTWWVGRESNTLRKIIQARYDAADVKAADGVPLHLGAAFVEYLDIPLGDVRRKRERSRVWSPVEYDLRHPVKACNEDPARRRRAK